MSTRTHDHPNQPTPAAISALQLAVSALEDAIRQTDPADTVQLARLGTALSMAAYRLHQANQGKEAGKDPKNQPDDPKMRSGEADQWRAELAKWLGWARENQAPPPHSGDADEPRG